MGAESAERGHSRLSKCRGHALNKRARLTTLSPNGANRDAEPKAPIHLFYFTKKACRPRLHPPQTQDRGFAHSIRTGLPGSFEAYEVDHKSTLGLISPSRSTGRKTNYRTKRIKHVRLPPKNPSHPQSFTPAPQQAATLPLTGRNDTAAAIGRFYFVWARDRPILICLGTG